MTSERDAIVGMLIHDGTLVIRNCRRLYNMAIARAARPSKTYRTHIITPTIHNKMANKIALYGSQNQYSLRTRNCH